MIRQPSCLLDDLVHSLQSSDRQLLVRGYPLVWSDGHRYTGQILIAASHGQVWSVITDYAQLSQCLPSVESSVVLETDGDRAIVEQIAVLQVLMATLRARVRTETIETPQSRIDFRLVEGDLKSMKGAWTLHSVTREQSSSPLLEPQAESLTLLKQTVRAEAGSGLLEGAFGMIFMSSMKENLIALRRESMQRSSIAAVSSGFGSDNSLSTS